MPKIIPVQETQEVSNQNYQTQENFNPSFISQKEAISYAARMGASDSMRGIKQIFGNLTGNEDLLEELKKKDKKLKMIFENPEYGGKATAAYFGSAVALDPIGWIPFVGWAKKAKTAKEGLKYGMTLGESTRYGAATGAGFSSIGYYGEDDISRAEGILYGGMGGAGLGYLGAKVSNAIHNKLNKNVPIIPTMEQRQKMFAEQRVDDAREGRTLTPQQVKELEKAAVEAVQEQRTSTLSKSKTGLDLRKNYEKIVGDKVWNVMVQNWGSGLVGVAAASGGYSALDDPEASELQKFGAAIAMGLAGAGGVKALKRIPLKENVTLGELVSKGMVDNYGLDPEYVIMKKGTLANINSLRQQFTDIVRATQAGLSPEEQKVFYGMLHGVMDDVPDLVKLKDSTRALIKEVGQQMVDVGLLDPKVFRKNAETYLHRSYNRVQDGSAPTEVINAVRKFKIIGDELRPRGKVKTTTLKAYNKPDSIWQKEKWEILDDSDPQKIRVRRDYTKEERVEFGEIENASFGIAETGRLMTNDLAAYKLFANIADSKFALSPEQFAKKVSDGDIIEDAYLQIPDTTKFKGKSFEVYEYGKLAGMYVPKEVSDDLRKYIPTTKNEFEKRLGRGYLGLVRLWKKSKTAWNPVVHTNNTLSNVLMYDNANGQYKFIKQGFDELKKGFEGNPDARIFNLAKQYGVFDVDILSRELTDESVDALSKAVKDLSNENLDEVSRSFSFSKKIYNGLNKIGGKSYKMTFGRMENWYQAEDQVFRMALFMDRLNKGLNPADAAADAKRWFIDYDINAPLINTLKNSATPFISYTYRVIPLLAETAAKRPWKFAKWAAFAGILNEIGSRYGVGSEEAERVLLPERFKERTYGLPFMPETFIKTPFKAGVSSETGEPTPLYVDTTRFIPGGDIFSLSEKGMPLPIPVPFSKAMTGQDKFFTLPQAVSPSFGVLGEILAPAMFGVDPFTLQKLEGLGLENDAKVKVQHILSRLNPNVPIPFILPEQYESFSSKKIREAFEQSVSEGQKKYGTQFSPLEAILSSFGFKLQPVEISKLLRIEDVRFKNIYGEARKKYFSLMREYKENPTERNKERIQKEIDNLYKVIENAERITTAKRLQVGEALERDANFEGGKIDPKYPVTDVKMNPSTRENMYTQQPFLEEEERLPLSWGGNVTAFEPLAAEIEQLASMQTSEQASMLNLGAMPMEEIERQSATKRIQQRRAGFSKGGIYDRVGKLFGIGGEQQRENEKQAAAFINKAVKDGLIDEREAIPVDKYGFVLSADKGGNVGEVFNAVNHGLLSYKYGQGPISRLALQAKEFGQSFSRPEDSRIDALNNSVGFNIRGSVNTIDEAGEALINKVIESRQKTQQGEKLVVGKDLFLTFEDIGRL